MKERPILFSAPMVRALLDGSKTQTRRVVKPAHLKFFDQSASDMLGAWNARPLPYGQIGDRLWVRETWAGPLMSNEKWEELSDTREIEKPEFCEYAADGGPKPEYLDAEENLVCKWVPSIFMPRWASRITLEITGVRVERLQDISRGDAIAEGAPPSHPSINKISRELGFADFSRSWYGHLWYQINGPGSWAVNPWVWVIEFKALQK